MATITLRIEDEEKKRLDAALANIGMNITTFYGIYTKKFLTELRIPFEISVNEPKEPFFSDENQKHLQAAINRLESGKGKEHELIEVDE